MLPIDLQYCALAWQVRGHHARGRGCMSFYDLRNVNILVVEDNGFMAKLLRAVLRGLAVGQVEDCLDPARVLDCIRDFQPDAIFIDREMPHLDGLEVVRRIRKGAGVPNPYVPIVMVTAHTKKAEVMEARDAGVTEFLAKPVSAKGVYDRLVACIEAPRLFIKTSAFRGPDRRRHADASYDGPEHRKKGPSPVG